LPITNFNFVYYLRIGLYHSNENKEEGKKTWYFAKYKYCLKICSGPHLKIKELIIKFLIYRGNKNMTILSKKNL